MIIKCSITAPRLGGLPQKSRTFYSKTNKASALLNRLHKKASIQSINVTVYTAILLATYNSLHPSRLVVFLLAFIRKLYIFISRFVQQQ